MFFSIGRRVRNIVHSIDRRTLSICIGVAGILCWCHERDILGIHGNWNWKPITEQLDEYILARSVQRSTLNTFELDAAKQYDKYVERKDLRDVLGKIINRTDANGNFFILYGAMATGKSVAVENALHGINGVFRVRVTSTSSRNSLIEQLTKHCSVSGVSNKDHYNLLHAFSKGNGSGKLVTIVFDVDCTACDGSMSAVYAARSVAKEFGVVCNCIIVMPEPNAMQPFYYSTREKFILVEGLSEVEAREYFKQRNYEVSEDDMNRIVNTIGTSPGMLKKMVGEIKSGQCTLDEFIQNTLKRARGRLFAFPLKPILLALKEHPNGVSTSYFDGQRYNGVFLPNPREVTVELRKHDIVIYDLEHHMYRLASKDVETALKTYDPIINE